MVRSRGRGGFRPGFLSKAAGVRTAWRAIDDGEFFCSGCGGDRSYQLLAGRRRLTVLGVPVLPRGPADPVVECASCHGHFPVVDLERPTTTRLAGLLRDAVHTIALAVLGVGGGERVTARRAAVASVRAAGFPDCTEERLLTLQAALWAGNGSAATRRLDPESWEVLSALAPHLAEPGREGLLLHGARVALADGPYRPGEREVLAAIGAALRLPPAETRRVLVAAATASGA
ncbi:TerB family tellurite resistance protein [Streptomyces sp. 6N223]|uniref:TerB family tellurite resistance protein n=1 Tax=Streptomyces sp. 6N223 TaxID=3457412 RepID=UPI003FD5FFCD